MEYSIVYNSDVIITDPVELSTFSIFYDKVLLPYADNGGHLAELVYKDGKYFVGALFVDMLLPTKDGLQTQSRDVIPGWEESNSVLFQEGVVTRLTKGAVSLNHSENVNELAVTFLKNPSTDKYKTEKGERQTIFMRSAIIEHLQRSDIAMPGIFTIRKDESKREVFKSLEAMHTFKYLMPALSALHPEQILEVRLKVKDVREGFSMHLQKLSASVESGLRENAPFEEISNNARKIIETALIPDYREFTSLIAARRTGFWARLLQTGGKVLEIDSAPWTPAFWGKLAQALGGAFSDEIKDGREQHSNANQAYKFMHICEQLGALPK